MEGRQNFSQTLSEGEAVSTCMKGGWLCGGGVALLCMHAVNVIVWAEWWKGICGVVEAVWLKWHCLWISGWLPVVCQHFFGNGRAWGTGWGCSVCVCVSWPLPSHLAFGHQSTLNKRFSLSCPTPWLTWITYYLVAIWLMSTTQNTL